MFGEPPPLSADLEWMLQNSRARDSEIIQLIVKEYYDLAFQQALEILNNSEAARQAAIAALASVVIQRFRYSSNVKLEDWIRDFTVQACKPYLSPIRVSTPARQKDSRDHAVPLAFLGDDQPLNIQDAVVALVKKKQQARSRSTQTRGVLFAAITITLLAVGMWFSNLLYEIEEFDQQQRVLTSSAAQIIALQAERTRLASLGIYLTPTPIPPNTPSSPLELSSDRQTIRRRLESNYLTWQTLWADVQLYHYGPGNYIGPPQASRAQIWVSRKVGALVLSGPPEGDPNIMWSLSSLQGIPGTANDPYRAIAMQFPWILMEGQQGLWDPWKAPSEWANSRTQYNIIQIDPVAGRETLVVDLINRNQERVARLWIDVLTGLTLRQQHFSNMNPPTVIREAMITAIMYDLDLSAEIFDQKTPTTWYYPDMPFLTNNPILEPPNQAARLSEKAAPDGFNPAEQPIVFRWTGDKPPGESEGITELYAGEYFLGETPISNPLNITLCRRSRDGWQIALVEITQQMNPAQISFVHLKNMEWKQASSTFFDVYDLSFSTDGGWLSILRTGEQTPSSFPPTGEISLLNTGNGQFVQSLSSGAIALLGWSEDGEYVGIVRRNQESGYPMAVYAIQVATGQEVRGQVDYARQNYPGQLSLGFHFPNLGWQGNYIEDKQGLEGCYAPPTR